MVTTVAADGVLHGRPMLLERVSDDATLVFLTHLSSTKVDDVAHDPRVNASFHTAKGDCYVSVGGRAAIVRDRARFRAMWHPTYRAWFPDGADDADAAIFEIAIEHIDLWDVPASRMVRVWSAVKALATGQVVESGTHQTIKP